MADLNSHWKSNYYCEKYSSISSDVLAKMRKHDFHNTPNWLVEWTTKAGILGDWNQCAGIALCRGWRLAIKLPQLHIDFIRALGLKAEDNMTRLTRDEPRGSIPWLGVKSIAQLKCTYTSAHSMHNKQEKLEAIMQQKSYDVVSITEMKWDDSQD